MWIRYSPANNEGQDDPLGVVEFDPGEQEIVAEASGVMLESVHDGYGFEAVYGLENAQAMWYPRAFVFSLLRSLDAEGRLEHLIGGRD